MFLRIFFYCRAKFYLKMRLRRCLSMRFKPVCARAAVGNERYSSAEGSLHLFFYNAGHRILFARNDVEVQLIVHLQQHLRPYSLAVKTTVNAVHRDFDAEV